MNNSEWWGSVGSEHDCSGTQTLSELKGTLHPWAVVMGHCMVHVERLARRGCRVQGVSHCQQISENHSRQIPANFTVLLLQQQRREREARRQQEREQRRREQEEKRRLEELERRRKEEEERRRAEEEKRRVEREQVSLSNPSICYPVELGTGSQMYSPVCVHICTLRSLSV